MACNSETLLTTTLECQLATETIADVGNNFTVMYRRFDSYDLTRNECD